MRGRRADYRACFLGFFWVLAILIAGFVAWFLGNLLYSLFWKLLLDWGIPITEAQMTGYIAAHFVPFALIIGAATLLGWLIRKPLSSVVTVNSGITMREYQLRHQERLALEEHTAELRRQREANGLDQKQLDQMASPTPFVISVGIDPDYYELIEYRNLNSLTKLFKLKLENSNRSKTVMRCKVFVTSTDPPSGNRMPWMLREGFSLAAGEPVFIPLVSYQERREPEKYSNEPTISDSFKIHTSSIKYGPLLGIGSSHILNVRCTGVDAKFLDQRIKLSVIGGKFRIEKV